MHLRGGGAAGVPPNLRRIVIMTGLVARVTGVGMLALVLFASVGDRAVAVQEPVVVPESGWLSVGTLKISGIDEIPSGTYPGVGQVLFGPVAGGTGEFLAAFQILGEGSVPVEGTYTLSKPGKPVLFVDIETLQEDLGPGAESVKVSIKAKLKKENGVDKLQLSMSLGFRDCELVARSPAVAGAAACRKVKLSYKGLGIRQEA